VAFRQLEGVVRHSTIPMLKFVNGDATVPRGDPEPLGHRAHLQQQGRAGRWIHRFAPRPLASSRGVRTGQWWAVGVHQGFRGGEVRFQLGEIQIVPVECARGGTPCIVVANMIAQNGINKRRRDQVPGRLHRPGSRAWRGAGIPPAKGGEGDVRMPRIGTGHACGEWKIIEALISRTLVDYGIDVTVYQWLSGKPVAISDFLSDADVRKCLKILA